MKRSIARKWAKALESGDYKQGRTQLRQGNSFCCIGVLCNLHAGEHPEIAATQKRKSEYLGVGDYAPNEVLKWSGMATPYGLVGAYVDTVFGRYNSLAQLNDNGFLTFPEIAKVIRKHWKEL